MKTIANKFHYILSLVVLFFYRAYAFAQDQGVSQTHTETHSTSSSGPADTTTVWYVAPWVWIAGVVLLIVILALIFRGGGGGGTRVTRVTEVND